MQGLGSSTSTRRDAADGGPPRRTATTEPESRDCTPGAPASFMDTLESFFLNSFAEWRAPRSDLLAACLTILRKATTGHIYSEEAPT